MAVVKNGCCISEDEVDGALYNTFSVKLAKGMSIESVLVGGEVTAEKSRV